MTLVVFTDLDGTLLDHARYCHKAAAPALARLRRLGVPLVLASSKTAAEMAPLHGELGLGDTPYIVENGAGVLWPGASDTSGAPARCAPAARDDSAYRRIRAALAALPPALSGSFCGFADLDADEIAALTGLAPEAARRAQARQFSEPGLWQGDAAGRDRFIAALAARGLSARRGGRFLTVSEGRTKADAMAEIAQALGATRTLALGDAPNDVEMLTAADRGIIVRNDHAPALPALPGEAEGRITRTALPGPAGWNAAVLAALGDPPVIERPPP